MKKRVVAFFVLVCVIFAFSACEFSDEIASEFGNQLKEAAEEEIDAAVEQAKSDVKNKVTKEAKKVILEKQIERFRDNLENVDVNKKNRAEMLFVMETILELCNKNGLTYEAMQIEALYNMSTLMVDSKSLYDTIDEIDTAVSDVSSLITGDYVQFFADKAVNKQMKKWEKQVDDSIDEAIEGTLHNIANNDKIWDKLTENYLKENGVKK